MVRFAWSSSDLDAVGSPLVGARDRRRAPGVDVAVGVETRRRASSPVGSWASCILALSIVWIQALGNHAAALGSGRTLAVVADGVHLLTACLWIGSLLAIALIVWPRWDSDATIDRSALVRACGTPVFPACCGQLCLVVATGLYSAGREVDTVGSVGTTTYGRTLLVKSVLVLAVVMLGGVNAARLHGWRPAWARPGTPPRGERALAPGRSCGAGGGCAHPASCRCPDGEPTGGCSGAPAGHGRSDEDSERLGGRSGRIHVDLPEPTRR